MKRNLFNTRTIENKMRWSALFFIGLLLMSGCTAIDLSSLFGSSPITVGKGVVLEWTEYPKKDLVENREFSLGLRVKNYAKTPVDATLCVRDALPDQYGGVPSDACTQIHLEKAQVTGSTVQPDAIEPAIFGPYTYHNLQPASYAPGIAAELKYTLQSIHDTPLCVLSPNFKGQLPSGVSCSASETKTDVRQDDLPLKITKITKDVGLISSNKVGVDLEITVAQVQDGTLLSNEQSGTEATHGYPLVDFTIDFLQIPLTCTPLKQGKIEMRENEKVIKCSGEYVLRGTDDFLQGPVVIHLGYGFRQISKIPSDIGLIPQEGSQV